MTAAAVVQLIEHLISKQGCLQKLQGSILKAWCSQLGLDDSSGCNEQYHVTNISWLHQLTVMEKLPIRNS